MSKLDFLYKYRSLAPGQPRDRTLDIINANRIYFCSPTSFNDPFEARFVLRVNATREQRLAYWTNAFRRCGHADESAQARAEQYNRLFESLPEDHHEAELRPILERAICEQAALLSLSARPDDLLMWAHYASSHTGLCLKFALSGDEPFFAVAQPVDYQDAYPEFNYFTSSPDEKLVRTLLTKSRHWEYEAEYRVIEAGGTPGLRSFHPSLLAGIILGARISDADRDALISLVGSRVPLYQAEVDRWEFRINIVNL